MSEPDETLEGIGPPSTWFAKRAADGTAEEIATGVTYLGQVSSTPTDAEIGAGNTAVYAKTDGKVYKKEHGGSEAEIGTGGGVDPVENTLANTDTAALLENDVETAHVIVIDEDNDETSLWFLRGTNNDAQLLFDSNNHFSETAGNAGTVNVYWSGARYEVENQTGSQITVAAIEGGGGSVTGSGGGQTDEEIRDLVAAFIVGGTDISVTHDDGANTLTLAYTGSGGGGSGDFQSGDGSTHTVYIQDSEPSSPSEDDLWIPT